MADDDFKSKVKSCLIHGLVFVFAPPLIVISFLLGQSALFWSIFGIISIIVASFVSCGEYCATSSKGSTQFYVILAIFVFCSTVCVFSDSASKLAKRLIGSVVLVLIIGISIVIRNNPAFVCLFFGLCLLVAYFRLWINACPEDLKRTQTELFHEYCHVPLIETVIADIGTVFVNATIDVTAVSSAENDIGKSIMDPSLGIHFIPSESPTQKPLLVLVHGYAAGNGFWMLNLDDLNRRFNVIAIDLPGYGMSTRFRWLYDDTDDALSMLVCMIEAWRVRVGIDKFVLLGHSLGAIVVSAYTSSYPQHVDHLILASPAGMTYQPGEKGIEEKDDEDDDDSVTDDAEDKSTGAAARRLNKEASASDQRKQRFKKRLVQGPMIWRFAHWYWKQNLTPMDLVRLAGPIGQFATQTWMTRRVSWSPETSALWNVNIALLSSYAYQNFAGAASGDRALGSLLSPFSWGRKPLMSMLKVHPLIRRRSDKDKNETTLATREETATADLATSETALVDTQLPPGSNSFMETLINIVTFRFLSWSVCDPVIVLPPNKQRSASYDRLVKDGHGKEEGGILCPLTMIYGCKAHDWMESDRGLKLVKKLKSQGLSRVKLYELDNCGHLLFLDDPRAFCERIEQCVFEE